MHWEDGSCTDRTWLNHQSPERCRFGWDPDTDRAQTQMDANRTQKQIDADSMQTWVWSPLPRCRPRCKQDPDPSANRTQTQMELRPDADSTTVGAATGSEPTGHTGVDKNSTYITGDTGDLPGHCLVGALPTHTTLLLGHFPTSGSDSGKGEQEAREVRRDSVPFPPWSLGTSSQACPCCSEDEPPRPGLTCQHTAVILL